MPLTVEDLAQACSAYLASKDVSAENIKNNQAKFKELAGIILANNSDLQVTYRQINRLGITLGQGRTTDSKILNEFISTEMAKVTQAAEAAIKQQAAEQAAKEAEESAKKQKELETQSAKEAEDAANKQREKEQQAAEAKKLASQEAAKEAAAFPGLSKEDKIAKISEAFHQFIAQNDIKTSIFQANNTLRTEIANISAYILDASASIVGISDRDLAAQKTTKAALLQETLDSTFANNLVKHIKTTFSIGNPDDNFNVGQEVAQLMKAQAEKVLGMLDQAAPAEAKQPVEATVIQKQPAPVKQEETVAKVEAPPLAQSSPGSTTTATIKASLTAPVITPQKVINPTVNLSATTPLIPAEALPISRSRITTAAKLDPDQKAIKDSEKQIEEQFDKLVKIDRNLRGIQAKLNDSIRRDKIALGITSRQPAVHQSPAVPLLATAPPNNPSQSKSEKVTSVLRDNRAIFLDLQLSQINGAIRPDNSQRSINMQNAALKLASAYSETLGEKLKDIVLDRNNANQWKNVTAELFHVAKYIHEAGQGINSSSLFKTTYLDKAVENLGKAAGFKTEEISNIKKEIATQVENDLGNKSTYQSKYTP